MTNTNKMLCLLLLVFPALTYAQDEIITTSGKVIESKIKKIGSNEIKYKKYGFQMKSNEIKTKKVLYIQYENGIRKYLNPITMADKYQSFGTMQPLNTKPGQFQKHYVERIDKSFRIDTNQVVGYKRINSILAQCPDTSVQVMLKAAKTMRTFSTISNILATPASAGGGFASYKTVDNFLEMKKAGEEINFNTYLGMGMSFLGTMALPITSAVLNSLKKKLYNRALTKYSNYTAME